MRVLTLVAVLVSALGIVRPVAAQTAEPISPLVLDAQRPGQKPAPAPRPPAKPQPIGFRAFVLYDIQSMAATETFDAILGTNQMSGVGVGGEVLRLWKQIFFRASWARMSETGSRVVFESDDDPVPVSVSKKLVLTPVELGGGWRFPLRRSPRFTPYAGGGFVFVGVDDSSDFATSGEDTTHSYSGYVVFGGVDIAIWKWISAGVEGAYRTVPDALGASEASALFDETDLGGMVFRVMVGIRK